MSSSTPFKREMWGGSYTDRARTLAIRYDGRGGLGEELREECSSLKLEIRILAFWGLWSSSVWGAEQAGSSSALLSIRARTAGSTLQAQQTTLRPQDSFWIHLTRVRVMRDALVMSSEEEEEAP